MNTTDEVASFIEKILSSQGGKSGLADLRNTLGRKFDAGQIEDALRQLAADQRLVLSDPMVYASPAVQEASERQLASESQALSVHVRKKRAQKVRSAIFWGVLSIGSIVGTIYAMGEYKRTGQGFTLYYGAIAAFVAMFIKTLAVDAKDMN